MQPYVFTSKNKAKRIFQSDIRCKDVDKKVKKQEIYPFFHFSHAPPDDFYPHFEYPHDMQVRHPFW